MSSEPVISWAPDSELLDDCVHCGFCLTTCPTYTLWGQEMDSPRGRIHLMNLGREGEPLGETLVKHFDRCLGCLACVTSCPSGVQYGELITQTREHIESSHRRSWRDRLIRGMIFGLFPRPRRLRLARGPLWVYQRLGLRRLLRIEKILMRVSPSLAVMESLTPPIGRRDRLPRVVEAQGSERARVAVLTGCVQREFFSSVNAATVRVLAAEGCRVVIPKGQGCCGALSAHTGRVDEARAYARELIDTLASQDVDFIVINAAGCGSTVKEYAELLQGDPAYAAKAAQFVTRVRDVSELLVELGPQADRHPLGITIAYHDACHLSHGQRIRSQPRLLLGSIPGVDVREIRDPDICCGSAGVYNIVQPEAGRELGDRKAANVVATGAELLVTANPGCAMQIATAVERAGGTLPMAHIVEVLDASIRGLGVEALAADRRSA